MEMPKGMERLEKQFDFLIALDKMKLIERRSPIYAGTRRENDAEHSWHIAVMAMLFEGYASEKADIGRVVEMCAVHDLVEIYAGDTFAYDEKGNLDKEAREKAAADRLFGSLPGETGEKLRSLQSRGLAERRETSWRLTGRGMDIQNSVLVELMDG